MNYNRVVPTLDRIAIIRSAVMLWNHDDIRTIMNNCYYPLFHKYRGLKLSNEKAQRDLHHHYIQFGVGNEDSLQNRVTKWLKVEDEMEKIRLAMEEKVTDKVQQLPIPNSLKEDLVCIIKPIGEEILKWIKFHGWYIGIDLPSELCWLPRGTVDEKRTAKLLTKDENIDPARRYKLACIYCLEEDIPKLWEKIPSSQKKNFYSEKGPNKVRQQDLVVFWTYAIMGKMDKWEKMIKESLQRLEREDCNPFQRAVEDAATTGNEAAMEYFLQKLTSPEREHSLMKCAELLDGTLIRVIALNYDLTRENSAQIFMFLFSQMSQHQQLEVLQKHTSKLDWLLDWPWQAYFMQAAKCVWSYIDASDLCYVLERILEKVTKGYKDYNYKNLFREFWQLISIHHERIVKDYLVDRRLLTTLFLNGDKENIKLILEDASTLVREKIIFSGEGKRICARLLYGDNEDLLNFFVKMCMSRKDLMKKFKKKLKKLIPNEVLLWSKFSEMLDGAFQADVKSDLEEGLSSACEKES